MIDPRIKAIQQMQNIAETNKNQNNKQNGSENSEVSFKEMINQYMDDANDLQIKADEDIQKVLAGEDIDPHKVMVAVEKANLSFELVMQIRNKMLEAYNEIIKMKM